MKKVDIFCGNKTLPADVINNIVSLLTNELVSSSRGLKHVRFFLLLIIIKYYLRIC